MAELQRVYSDESNAKLYRLQVPVVGKEPRLLSSIMTHWVVVKLSSLLEVAIDCGLTANCSIGRDVTKFEFKFDNFERFQQIRNSSSVLSTFMFSANPCSTTDFICTIRSRLLQRARTNLFFSNSTYHC